jgi:hypothetical protein
MDLTKVQEMKFGEKFNQMIFTLRAKYPTINYVFHFSYKFVDQIKSAPKDMKIFNKECLICYAKSNIVLQCGHSYCDFCVTQINKCGYCLTAIKDIYFVSFD